MTSLEERREGEQTRHIKGGERRQSAREGDSATERGHHAGPPPELKQKEEATVSTWGFCWDTYLLQNCLS